MREFVQRRLLCLVCFGLAGVNAFGQPESTVNSTEADSPWHAEIKTFERAALADAPSETNDGIRVLTLRDALQITLDTNPSLAAKRAELGVAEGELRQASIYFQHNPVIEAWAARRRIPGSTDVDPSAGLSLGPRDLRVPYAASRALESLGGGPQPSPGEVASSLLSSGVEAANNRALGFSLDETLSKTDDEDYVDFGIEISQELEIFGQPKARRNAAQAGLDVKVAEIAAAAWDALAETRKAYYALQIAEARLRLNEEQLQFANELEALAKRRFEQGDIARTDYRQQEIQGSRFAATKALAELAVESARSDLRLAIGVEPGEFLTTEAILPAPLPLPSDVAATVESVNPQLELARARVEYGDRNALFVRRSARPNITGRAFWTREEDDIDIFGGGISIPVPVFNRGQGDIAAAKAQVDVAQARLVAVQRQIEERTREAINRYTETQIIAESYYSDVLSMVKQNLESLTNAVHVGELSLIELRLAQRESLDAQNAALDLLDQHYRWRAELEGLLGRGLDESGTPIQESTRE